MKRFWVLFAAFPLFAASVVPNRYIVELSSTPVAVHAANTAPRGRVKEMMHSAGAERQRLVIRAEQASARSAVEAAGGAVVDSVENVRNALIVRIPDAQANRLAGIAGVQRVHPVRLFSLTLDHALPLHHVPDAWKQVGIANAGAGIKIGMIDTGISISHPGFQDAGFTAPAGYPIYDNDADKAFTNNKVIVARSYASMFIKSDPDPTVQDEQGHGTGTAMAAAGVKNTGPLATISGVAPQAYLGIYKVFGSPGVNASAPEDAIIKAIDDAVGDGMDVLNLSLGSDLAGPPSQDPEVAALDAASALGVIVVVSAGNNGPNPGTIGTPAISHSVIAVGASNNDRVFAAWVALPDGTLVTARPGSASTQASTVSGSLVDVAQFDHTGLACSALPANSLSGIVVLIQRGTCTFVTKLNNASAAGAVGAVVYGNTTEPLANMATNGTTLPSEFVSQSDGQNLKQLITGGLAVTMQFATPQYANPAGLAGFSAAGPSVDYVIKPDMSSVGANFYTAAESINSAGELYDPSGYTVTQGTSFSAPLVAGAAALVKAARPGLTSDQYRSLLVNSASQAYTAPGVTARIQQAGAGVLDTLAALNATVTASPVSLSFGMGTADVNVTQSLTVTNIGADDTFQIWATARDAGAPVPQLMSGSMQLAAAASMPVALKFSAAGLAPGPYEGFINIQGSNSSVTTRVPYWYGVPSNQPAFVTVLYNVGSSGAATAGSVLSHAVIFRVTDTAGLPVSDVAPSITVLAGDGKATGLAPISGFAPGSYTFTARLGPTAGANTYQIQAGSATATVSITGQ